MTQALVRSLNNHIFVLMENTFIIAGTSVDTDVLDLFEVVMGIVKDRRRKGQQRIRGHDLWSEVSKTDLRFVRCVA